MPAWIKGILFVVWMASWTYLFCLYYKGKLEREREEELKKRWITLTY